MNPHDAPWHKESTRLSFWVGRADELCGEDGANSERAFASERCEVRYRPRQSYGRKNSYYQYRVASNMASMYYACADCGNAIQEIKMSRLWDELNRIGEYCDCCSNWNPEVVVAYG